MKSDKKIHEWNLLGIVLQGIVTILVGIGAVLAFITAKIQNKIMYVLCLVLGILTGNLFFLIGGILGLIKD